MDLSFIKDEFFPKISARKINNGNCFNWAYIVYLLLEDKEVSLYSDDEFVHAFVKIGDLYYDSECPTGVNCWEDLPTYQRYPNNYGIVSEYDLEDFLHGWGMYGKSWDMLPDIPDLVDYYLDSKRSYEMSA